MDIDKIAQAKAVPAEVVFENSDSAGELSDGSLLNEDDLKWLNRISLKELTEDDLFKINILAKAGSVEMGTRRSDKEDNQIIRNARHKFFDYLGWDEGDSTLAKNYRSAKKSRPSFVPINTFVKTQKYLSDLGVDNERVIKDCFTALTYSKEKIEEKLNVLEGLGLNPVEVVNEAPRVIETKTEDIEPRIRFLENLGLKPQKIINGFRNVFSVSEAYVISKIELIESFEADYKKVFNKCSSLFSYGDKAIVDKVEGLKELGFIDIVSALNGSPSILTFTKENIKEKMDFLGELGLSSEEIVIKWPGITTLSKQNIGETVDLFKKLIEESISVSAQKTSDEKDQIIIDKVDQIIIEHPRVVSLGNANIENKWRLFNDGFGYDLVNMEPKNIKKLIMINKDLCNKLSEQSDDLLKSIAYDELMALSGKFNRLKRKGFETEFVNNYFMRRLGYAALQESEV